jgi:tripartite-type tricarboxylate transporter receptor subunit TctC
VKNIKISVLIVAILLVLALIVGCGNETGTNDNEQEANEQQIKYPEKNVQVIVPFGAGGGTDTQARMFLSEMEKHLGKSFIVVNKPGAKGDIGNTEIANASPDGYTLGVLAYPDNVVLENYQETSYTMDEDFIPIATYTASPTCLIVDGDRFPTLDDFIKYAKEHPGELTLGIASDSHLLSIILLEEEAGIDLTPVIFESGGMALNGAVGGHIDGAFIAVQFAIAGLDQGMTTIGVAGSERLPKLPDSPTFKELGMDIEVLQSRPLVAPKGTPQQVIDKLIEVARKTGDDPGFKEKFENMGDVYVFLSGDELAAFCAQTNAKIKEVVSKHKEAFLE